MARPVTARVWLKRALLLIVIGLIVQLFCLVHVTPGSFVLFAGAGVGAVFLGLVLFVVAAVRARRTGTGEVDDAG